MTDPPERKPPRSAQSRAKLAKSLDTAASMYDARSMYDATSMGTATRSMYAARSMDDRAEFGGNRSDEQVIAPSGSTQKLSTGRRRTSRSTLPPLAPRTGFHAQWLPMPERPLRVAHINAALIPAGIEYWLASLARYANPRYLKFLRTVVLTDWVDARQVSRMGMPVEVGGRESVIAAASQCDVLLVSDPGKHSQDVAHWILQAKPPLVVFVAHGDGAYTASRMAGIGSAVDHIVAVTEHVRDEVCDGWPVSVILNGVDPQRLVQTRPRGVLRRNLGFSAEDFVVGFVGRFSEEKNPQLVVDAVERLPSHAKLLLVGHGCLEEELVRQCRSRLLGRFVIMEGDGDLGDVYAAMDTLVMPSRLEGYGLVAMEAMMSGVPVVATPFGMVADLVTDHVHAMVVDPNANAIAAAIHKLAQFPHFRQLIIRGGRELASRTGYASEMAVQYEQLLTQLWMEATGNGAMGASHAHR